MATHPHLAAQWHPSLNGSRRPDEFGRGSDTKAWWCCPAGPDHQWEATVSSRTSGVGCPFCAGRAVSVTNRLDLLRPDLAAQWDRVANRLTPDQVTVGTTVRAWWRCAYGHVWQTRVRERTRDGEGTDCPQCGVLHRSVREIRLAFELAQFMTFNVDDQVVTLLDDTRVTCDIVLRDYRIIVEYDGSHWHKHRGTQDENKTARLVAAGWTVIRLREHPLPRIGQHDVAMPAHCGLRKLTIATLEAITAATGQDAFNMSSYRKPGPLWGQKDADEWIAARLADRDDERRCTVWNSAGERCTRNRDRRNGMCATHASRTDRHSHPQADIPIRTPHSRWTQRPEGTLKAG